MNPHSQVLSIEISVFALAALACTPVSAQVVHDAGTWQSTLEAYANVTAGDETYGHTVDAAGADDARLDAALRLLLRTRDSTGPNWGVRLVVEQSPDADLDV
ncbi:MAG TPA: hypothetical protein VF277_09305, partial [Steroidobacteraceae bacterium]